MTLEAKVPLVLLNKPFRVLSQFTTDGAKATLADYVDLPDVYPAGRLDYDSEGLLLLTDDGRLQAAISEPRRKLAKHYWVQVEGDVTREQIGTLRQGVRLKDGHSRFEQVAAIQEPDALWPRIPPIRERASIPDHWIDVSLTEGRNRQVRRTTAAAGLPTLRLIRYQIGPWSLDGLEPGHTRVLDNRDAWSELNAWRRR